MKRAERVFRNITGLAALLAFLGLPQALIASELGSESIYQLNVPLETHRGDAVEFASLRGSPVIISMFYGSCPHVCPMLISTIRQIEGQLPAEARGRLRVAMVSVDPARDTAEHLSEVAKAYGVNSERWVLARTSLDRTRLLAAVLGIRYKALPDGAFNHTSVVILYDAEGREVARSSKLGLPDPEFVRKVGVLLNGPVNTS